jgi:hypothetical protein
MTTSRSTRKGWWGRKTTRWSTSALTTWTTTSSAATQNGAVAENSGDSLVRSAQAFDQALAATAFVQSTAFADRWDLHGDELNADGAQIGQAESLDRITVAADLSPIVASPYGHLDDLGVSQSLDQWVLPDAAIAPEPEVGDMAIAMVAIEAAMDADAEADAVQVPRRDPNLYYAHDT